jgi:hypothetical protein
MTTIKNVSGVTKPQLQVLGLYITKLLHRYLYKGHSKEFLEEIFLTMMESDIEPSICAKNMKYVHNITNKDRFNTFEILAGLKNDEELPAIYFQMWHYLQVLPQAISVTIEQIKLFILSKATTEPNEDISELKKYINNILT